MAALPAYPATAEGRGHDGLLFSVLPSPIYEEVSTKSFSAIVRGLGCPLWKDCEAALGRMEFLALQVVVRRRSALLDKDKAATEWRSIEQDLQCHRSVASPHPRTAVALHTPRAPPCDLQG